MKRIKKFENFLFESEGFTQEDYENYKSYFRKSKKNIPATPEEKAAVAKHALLKKTGMDPSAPFKKPPVETEVFTQQDYENVRSYNSKEYFKYKDGTPYSLSPEEIESHSKYLRMKRAGMDPMGPYMKANKWSKMELTPEDMSDEEYKNYLEYNKKKRDWLSIGQSYTPDDQERDSIRKYRAMLKKGVSPASVRGKMTRWEDIDLSPEDYTQEDRDLYLSYHRKAGNAKRQGVVFEPSEQEINAVRKREAFKRMGILPEF
jgi:hypothetical protein